MAMRRSLATPELLDALCGPQQPVTEIRYVAAPCPRACCNGVGEEDADRWFLVLCAAVALVLVALFALSVVQGVGR